VDGSRYRGHVGFDGTGSRHISVLAGLAAQRGAERGAVLGNRPTRPRGRLDELGTCHLPQVHDALPVGGNGQVGRFAGLGGERCEMGAGQLVQRVGTQAGGGELAQPGAGVVVTVLVATH